MKYTVVVIDNETKNELFRQQSSNLHFNQTSKLRVLDGPFGRVTEMMSEGSEVTIKGTFFGIKPKRKVVRKKRSKKRVRK